MSTSPYFTDITKALASANASPAGTKTIVANGVYDHTQGREALSKAGAILQAQEKGKVIIKRNPIDVLGEKSTFDGFLCQYDSKDQTVINVRGLECNFINNILNIATTVPITTRQDWLVVRGAGAKIQNNESFGKKGLGNQILVGSGAAFVPNVIISGNYLHDQIYTPPTSTDPTNGAECLRVGSSDVANQLFNCQIYKNKIEKIKTSDTELFTIKSSANNVFENEIIDCTNTITFRHGHRNKFVNNTIVNGGVRIYGKDNIITDNTIIKNSQSQIRQFVIGNGSVEEDVIGSNAEYSRVKNNTIERNKILNEDAADRILFCFGYGDGALKPTGNFIRDNTITASKGTLASTYAGASWSGNTVERNILWATGTAIYGNMPATGFTKKDPIVVTPPPEPTPPKPLTVEERLTYLETKLKELEAQIMK